MTDDKGEVNSEIISYNIKLSSLGKIQNITMTEHMIINFHNIIVVVFFYSQYQTHLIIFIINICWIFSSLFDGSTNFQ